MNNNNINDPIDLGSVSAEEFDPFANDDDFAEDNSSGTNDIIASTPVPQSEEPIVQAHVSQQVEVTTTSDNDAESSDINNPLESAINAAETKDTEAAKQNIYEKSPVFEYAGAIENIDDSSQTFEELRIAKAIDFPELEDGKRVKWAVEYGKMTKEVSDAKGMSIAKMKSNIETSKEFLDALKKAKDKNPVCKIKPRVTAQSKGFSEGYKGVFTNIADVDAAGKAISILPAKDGQVYEIRDNPLGRFITPVVGCEFLSDVKAGFIPAFGIPRIPRDLIIQIIAFFRYYTHNGDGNEVLVNIYWDKKDKIFIVDTPEQIVSKVSVHSSENTDYLNERYIHYMDIHSHNSMRAFFSAIDDRDEKATRLYTVIGRLDNYMPEIKTRISNGGKFHEIDSSEVFQYISLPFPDKWKENISLRASHEDSAANRALPARNNHCFRTTGNNDFPCRSGGNCNCRDGDSS